MNYIELSIIYILNILELKDILLLLAYSTLLILNSYYLSRLLSHDNKFYNTKKYRNKRFRFLYNITLLLVFIFTLFNLYYIFIYREPNPYPPMGAVHSLSNMYYTDPEYNAFVLDGVNLSRYYQSNSGYVGRDTWYVYGRTQEVGYDIKNLNYNQFLDKWSFEWAPMAAMIGLRVDNQNPRTGDIAVWTRYKHSGYIWAHCAFIEKERLGTVWVTESNLTDKPDGSTPARIKPGVPRVVVTEDEGYITDNWDRSTKTGVYLYDAPYDDPPATGIKLLKKFDQLDILGEDYRRSSNGEWYYWYQLKLTTPQGEIVGWARLEERRPDLDKYTGQKEMSVPNFEFNFTGIDTTPHFINKYWPDLPDLQYIHLENRSTN